MCLMEPKYSLDNEVKWLQQIYGRSSKILFDVYSSNSRKASCKRLVVVSISPKIYQCLSCPNANHVIGS